MEGAGGGDTDGGHETEDSEGERSSRGDETVRASERWTASGGHRQSRWKRRGQSGSGEPNEPRQPSAHKTLESSELHERQHGRRRRRLCIRFESQTFVGEPAFPAFQSSRQPFSISQIPPALLL